MEFDKSTWYNDLSDEDQDFIHDEAIDLFSELIETGSVTLKLPSEVQFVLSLTVTKE